MKTNSNIRVQWLAVLVGLLLLIVKFVAYFWTNSNAILTDALESIVNVLAGVFTLVSLYFAARPKDRNHPYGHGKVEFLSAAFEGGLIVLAGIAMMVKAGYNLFHPIEIKSLDIGMVLIGAAGFVNYGMGWLLIQQGEKGNSLALKAGGAHLQSDAYSTVGLFLGLGLM
ncbi:MAG: cation diffusion facilitator family transporter, partial [Chitinophagales bacterium]